MYNNGNQQTVVLMDKAYTAKRGGGTIAGFHEIHLLDEGAIAVFDEQNNMLASNVSAATIANVQQFYIAQGMPTAGTFRKTIPIDRSAFHRITAAPTPAVQQRVVIGRSDAVGNPGSMNFPGTFLDNTYATVVLSLTTPMPNMPASTARATVAVSSTSTATTIINALVAKINSIFGEFVVASNLANLGIGILGLNGATFQVGVDDIIVNATVYKDGATATNGSAAFFPGQGTVQQVQNLLMENAVTEGDQFRASALRNSPYGPGYWNVLEIVPTGTFDIWNIQWKSEERRTYATINVQNPQVNLCILTTSTGKAAVTTLLGTLLQTPSGESGGSAAGDSSGEGNTVATVPAGGQG